jgi:hypothetical protein
MSINLHRVRFQETYGDHRGDYLEETVTHGEVLALLDRYAHEWFPDVATLMQDPDSPNTWTLTEDTDEGRKVFFFVEQVG